MKTLQRKRILGFTIIELMIVLMIVAILLALAYPSYTQYARKAKRGEAQQLILNWSINQEIWRSNNSEYASTTNLPAPTNDHYAFDTIGTLDGANYTLQADGGGDQVNDKARDGTPCKTLTMNQSGVKLPAPCWE